MFDFPITEHSIETAVFCIAIYILILYKNYTTGLKYQYIRQSSSNFRIINILLSGLIIVIFCRKGDFFHMMEHVHNYEFIEGAYNYGEDIYIKIAYLINKNYLLFRTIVWGGAFVLYCWTAKRMSVPIYYAAMLITCSYIVLFTYARATAAMAVYFFGLSFICKPIKKIKLISFIIGAIIIYQSWEFHNSAIIMILISFIIFVPIRKWSFILLIIGLPIILYILRNSFQTAVEYADATNEIIAERMKRYSNSERGSNISEMIINIFKYSALYIPFILSTIVIYTKNNRHTIANHIIRMHKVAFGIVFTASIFYLFGSSFYKLFYRVLYMSMIPLCIIVTYLYKEQYLSPKLFKWCYIPGIINCILALIYDLYSIYVNS